MAFFSGNAGVGVKEMFGSTYSPSHAENRMMLEGDVESARARYLSRPREALTRLLEQRYFWMNKYLDGRNAVVEFGSGAGFSKLFLDCPGLQLTDVAPKPWLDKTVDAMAPPFADGSLDVVICSHMIHHLYSPKKFFKIIRMKLKPGGLILIHEINTSLMMRVLLRIMRHEGWSYDVDVFDETAIVNNPNDPWSGNCAIPEMLFRDGAAFERNVPGFKIELNETNECLLFPLSGGVTAKMTMINLPSWALSAVQKLDKILVMAMPGVFALGRSVVLRRI